MGSQALGLSQASAVPYKCVEALKQVRTLRLLHFTRWHIWTSAQRDAHCALRDGPCALEALRLKIFRTRVKDFRRISRKSVERPVRLPWKVRQASSRKPAASKVPRHGLAGQPRSRWVHAPSSGRRARDSGITALRHIRYVRRTAHW